MALAMVPQMYAQSMSKFLIYQQSVRLEEANVLKEKGEHLAVYHLRRKRPLVTFLWLETNFVLMVHLCSWIIKTLSTLINCFFIYIQGLIIWPHPLDMRLKVITSNRLALLKIVWFLRSSVNMFVIKDMLKLCLLTRV